jgi:putative solute:sodium symporter small subunit
MLAVLLTIWFTVSFGFGNILRDTLDQFSMGGARLGFWFAQQGSIICFLILLFAYKVMMNKLDHKYGYDEEAK